MEEEDEEMMDEWMNGGRRWRNRNKNLLLMVHI
jgi:hypothetical protein